MEFNNEYIKGLIEIKRIESSYKNGKELPLVARTLIELGNDYNIEVQINYGVNNENNTLSSGYWVKLPKYKKQIFLEDVMVDDDSAENIELAKDFMLKSIKLLCNLNDN